MARMSGDMVLVNDQLQRLDDAVLLARRTLSVIRQNLWWAAGYNLVALPLAISGHLTPGWPAWAWRAALCWWSAMRCGWCGAAEPVARAPVHRIT